MCGRLAAAALLTQGRVSTVISHGGEHGASARHPGRCSARGTTANEPLARGTSAGPILEARLTEQVHLRRARHSRTARRRQAQSVCGPTAERRTTQQKKKGSAREEDCSE